MEVVQDLDTEASSTAAEAGVEMIRVPTVGTDGVFVAGLAALIREARGGEPRSVAFGQSLPAPCLKGCCPNMRRTLPALCEAEV